MTDAVQRMLEQLDPGARPPLENWDPPFSGVIDIRIAGDGRWFHEGDEIVRFELVKLFASILRYEDDRGYVLVTPVEKWQIEVEDAPFIAVAMASRREAGQDCLFFVTNVGDEVCAGVDHPIVLRSDAGQSKPYIHVRDGLQARLSRPVYYELADIAVEHGGRSGVWSSSQFFSL